MNPTTYGDASDHIAALEREIAAFRVAVTEMPLDRAVPQLGSGPGAGTGWSVADLIHHMTQVQYFWGEVVRQRATGWKQVAALARAADDALIAAFDEHHATLVATLGATPPDTRVWTWSDQQDV
ncbi:MAG TPA: maleylpyruvate isomerase N-terminal domain-containing protein, partial [Ilumatobacteraceae bacterium]|nr:maleylpyruvate isomerase N-terminal domain-containing protein [Ilumatobacteraceae bacterium]